MNKILFAGCSFTADCGFLVDNVAKYHWPILLSNHYKLEYKNIAIGGSSNDEIFFRTVEATAIDNYELVVVMWSELGRKFTYYADNNVDDFTIINNGQPCGFQYNKSEIKTYSKLYYTYFDNQYMALKHWLLYIIALQNTFRNKQQKFLFIKGFENCLVDFFKVKHIANRFLMLSDTLKSMLDHHNRSDEYIFEKINSIKILINKIDQTNWLNFDSKSFSAMCVDVADDQKHPGPKTNKLLLDHIIEYFDKNKILHS